jgi:hypothetical protein
MTVLKGSLRMRHRCRLDRSVERRERVSILPAAIREEVAAERMRFKLTR